MYRQPAERPKNRLPLLDRLTVKTPCKASWDAMSGDDRARFCFSCGKNVYDVKAMSEDEAEAFLAHQLDDEEARVRLYRRPDGRILVTDCPRGATRRHRRRVALAASVTACAIAALAAAVGDVRMARAHHTPQSSRFEVPRSPVSEAPRRDFEIDPPRPDELHGSWGRADEFPLGQGFGTAATPNAPLLFVSVDFVEAKDGFSPFVIEGYVRNYLGRHRLCYADALGKDPRLSGQVVVRFAIGTGGHVFEAKAGGLAARSADFASCVARAISSVTFPSPLFGPVGVTVALDFHVEH